MPPTLPGVPWCFITILAASKALGPGGSAGPGLGHLCDDSLELFKVHRAVPGQVSLLDHLLQLLVGDLRVADLLGHSPQVRHAYPVATRRREHLSRRSADGRRVGCLPEALADLLLRRPLKLSGPVLPGFGPSTSLLSMICSKLSNETLPVPFLSISCNPISPDRPSSPLS